MQDNSESKAGHDTMCTQISVALGVADTFSNILVW